jgi:hypothetical protein
MRTRPVRKGLPVVVPMEALFSWREAVLDDSVVSLAFLGRLDKSYRSSSKNPHAYGYQDTIARYSELEDISHPGESFMFSEKTYHWVTPDDNAHGIACSIITYGSNPVCCCSFFA